MGLSLGWVCRLGGFIVGVGLSWVEFVVGMGLSWGGFVWGRDGFYYINFVGWVCRSGSLWWVCRLGGFIVGWVCRGLSLSLGLVCRGEGLSGVGFSWVGMGFTI